MQNTVTQAALLIDADNLSLDGMKEALHQLEMQHRVSLRRAYGSHETLGTVREFLHRKAVRAIANQGKGTTDAALVVDAMDLLHANGLPALVAIGSGGAYAQAAAKALVDHTELPARDVVKKSLEIAGELCIYTNMHHTIETL